MVHPDHISIPFHVRLVRHERIEDRLRHSLEFGVVGVKKPAAVMIGSDFYRSPVVEERLDRGGIDLSDRLMDALAVACFRVVVGFVIDGDGECGTWTARDITRWVRRHFTADDAAQILRALSLHVTPGLVVQDCVVVGDDDVVLADDYR
jgi:hypothetical protein